MPVILEQTSLRQVQKKLGGTIGSAGDAADFAQWLCFSGTEADARWILWLESDEIHNGDVSGFLLKQIATDAKGDLRCGVLKNSKVELPLSLRLGATEAGVLQALGKPTARKQDDLFYWHEHKVIIRKEPYDCDNSVTLALRNRLVWSLQVWKSTVS